MRLHAHAAAAAEKRAAADTSLSNFFMKRGAFILFEGCDRCGKSTQVSDEHARHSFNCCHSMAQVAQLVDALNSLGIKTRRQAFPDRTTTLGTIINQYLTNAIEMDDRAAHLLFAGDFRSVTRNP